MMKRFYMAIIFGLLALPAAAFSQVSSKAEFQTLMDGRTLNIGLYGLRLSVLDNGTITGRAAGYDVTGTWRWENGYFCRDMNWGGDSIGFNCQKVEWDGGNQMRFTSDKGEGRSAKFRLRN